MSFRLEALMLAGTLAMSFVIQDARQIAGCYRFDRAYFQWVVMRGRVTPRGADSTNLVELKPRAENPYRWREVPGFDILPIPFTDDSTTARRWLQFSHWELQPGDTVSVVWRNGLYGPVFRLVLSADTLRGQVRFTTDVVGAEPPPEPAWGVKVACP